MDFLQILLDGLPDVALDATIYLPFTTLSPDLIVVFQSLRSIKRNAETVTIAFPSRFTDVCTALPLGDLPLFDKACYHINFANLAPKLTSRCTMFDEKITSLANVKRQYPRAKSLYLFRSAFVRKPVPRSERAVLEFNDLVEVGIAPDSTFGRPFSLPFLREFLRIHRSLRVLYCRKVVLNHADFYALPSGLKKLALHDCFLQLPKPPVVTGTFSKSAQDEEDKDAGGHLLAKLSQTLEVLSWKGSSYKKLTFLMEPLCALRRLDIECNEPFDAEVGACFPDTLEDLSLKFSLENTEQRFDLLEHVSRLRRLRRLALAQFLHALPMCLIDSQHLVGLVLALPHLQQLSLGGQLKLQVRQVFLP